MGMVGRYALKLEFDDEEANGLFMEVYVDKKYGGAPCIFCTNNPDTCERFLTPKGAQKKFYEICQYRGLNGSRLISGVVLVDKEPLGSKLRRM